MPTGPVVPQSVAIRHQARCCPFYSSCPDLWTNTYPLDSVPSAVQLGTETFHESALALLGSDGQPTNQSQLESLDNQFISDLYSWKQTQFDETFVGSIAPVPNGILDTIEWDLGSSNGLSKTRIFTSPQNFPVYHSLGHQVPNADADCPDGTTFLATRTPCIEVLGPPLEAGNTNSSFKLDKWLICLEDGRLRQKYLGQDTLTCGCGTEHVCVTECGIPLVGVTVNVYSGGVLIDSCVTGSNGCCDLAESGTYLVQVVSGGTIIYSATRTIPSGGTLSIAISPGSNTVCCGGYLIPTNLTLTDAAGSLSFVYNPNSFYPTWYGGHAVQRLSCSVTTPNNICVAAPATIGPVRVCYQMICYGGQNPTFALQRSWSWVYQPGTLAPIWYQDPSGFVPGQPCTTGPPAMCGSPHTDVSTDSENPTSTSPFAINFSPVPAVSNYTGDPVGGTVAIS